MADERAARQTRVHEAMATRFSVQVVHGEPRYAGQAVAAAFDESGWSLTFGNGQQLRRRQLSCAAFSGSGLGVKGHHISGTRTQVSRRADACERGLRPGPLPRRMPSPQRSW